MLELLQNKKELSKSESKIFVEKYLDESSDTGGVVHVTDKIGAYYHLLNTPFTVDFGGKESFVLVSVDTDLQNYQKIVVVPYRKFSGPLYLKWKSFMLNTVLDKHYGILKGGYGDVLMKRYDINFRHLHNPRIMYTLSKLLTLHHTDVLSLRKDIENTWFVESKTYQDLKHVKDLVIEEDGPFSIYEKSVIFEIRDRNTKEGKPELSREYVSDCFKLMKKSNKDFNETYQRDKVYYFKPWSNQLEHYVKGSRIPYVGCYEPVILHLYSLCTEAEFNTKNILHESPYP